MKRNFTYLFCLILSVVTITANAQSGNVFNDLNGNGLKDVGEPGVAGVNVKSYSQWELLYSFTTTDTAGNYTLPLGALTPTQKLRIEFTIPAALNYFKPSFNSNNYGSGIQFTTGVMNNINFAVCNPSKSINGDPILVHSRYTFGNQVTGQFKDTCVLFGARNSWGTTSASGYYNDWHTNEPYRIAMAKEIGSVFGIAYSKKRNTIFTSAFFRQFNGFGPNGPGAIYKIPYNYATGQRTANPSLLKDVTTLSGQSMAADPHGTDIPLNFAATPLSSDTRMNLVGKYSLGGLKLSDDETKLYTVNLSNREVIAINPDNGNLIARWAIPTSGLTNSLGSVNTNDVRPFALGYKNGKLYVGAVCSGTSTQTNNGTAAGAAGNNNALHAYVWQLNETTNTFRLVLSFKLNQASSKWFTWQDSWANGVRKINSSAYAINQAQPILSTIDFYGDDMILGFRNRLNDQWGVNLMDPVINDYVYTQSWGDIIGAKYVYATDAFTVETNGTIGTRTATGSAGVATGYNEFYRADGANVSGWDDYFENATGSFVQVGGGHLASLQNFPTFSLNVWPDGDHAGITWINNQNGSAVKAYNTFVGDLFNCPAGKSNGLGSIEAVTDAMPLEIGNRVWNDADGNGIQSSNEVGYANVNLELLDSTGTIILGSTITNANGGYGFNNTNVTGGLKPNTKYKLRIKSTQYSTSGGWGPIAGTTLSASGVVGAGAPGVSDNDAVNVSGIAMINVTTGDIGENNLDIDLGLKPNILAVSNITTFTAVKNNNTVNLNWVTTYEQDLAKFEVERSIDGANWIKIGTVNGSLNSNVAKNYALFDVNPSLAKTNLYRLKQIGTDGAFHYSEIRSVKMSGYDIVSIYPNPAKSKTTLNVPTALQGEQILVKVISANGQVVKQFNFNNTISQESLLLDGIAAGSYNVMVSTKDASVQNLKLQIIK